MSQRMFRFRHATLLVAVPLLVACTADGGPADVAADVAGGGDDIAGDTATTPPEPLCVAESPVPIPPGCDACHGMPPTEGRHPLDARCSHCHGYTVDADFAFADASRHDDGTVDTAVGCSSCHGWNLGVSPPPDLSGGCTPGSGGVGNHWAMRHASIPVHQVGCVNCHPVPLQRTSPGHDDGTVDVVFSALATAGGATPTWDGTTCSNVYCHGATLTGGTLTAPRWQDTSHAPSKCGACHALSCPNGPKGSDCSTCHGATVATDGTLLPEGRHMNGQIDVTDASGGGDR